MTYEELATEIGKLTPKDQQREVVVYYVDRDEVYPLSELAPLSVGAEDDDVPCLLTGPRKGPKKDGFFKII
jgi:hypothetical protein